MRRMLTLALLLCLSVPGFSYSKNYAKELSSAFVNVAKKATPGVVYIRVENTSGYDRYSDDSANDFFSDEFFDHFFGGRPRGRRQQQAPQLSQGSGFIVSADGYVMTNYHVVKDAKSITITVQDGHDTQYEATLVGGDPQTDLAVLKMKEDKEPFPYLEFGNSNEMEVGEWVMAIGSPFQLEASVTVGVVSAKGRQNLQITDLEDFIQTDAAINPGNSGGPLLNLDGEVIGVNTAIVSPSGGYIGIGFAIPSQIVSSIANQVIKTGKISRGFLGVSLQPIDKDLAASFNLERPEGALVADVVPDSPAEKAGLKQGDIIIGFDNHMIKSREQLKNDIMLLEPGRTIKLKVNRQGKILDISVTLGDHTDIHGSNEMSDHELGFHVENLSSSNLAKFRLHPDEKGVVITDVMKGSVAAKAGLRPGFVIMAVNHNKVSNVSEFNAALSNVSDNNRVLLLVKQGDIVRFHSLKLK